MCFIQFWATRIWLLSVFQIITGGCQVTAVEIERHDRVLCVGIDVPLESEGRQRVQIPFGTLLKVADIKGDRYLVFDSFNCGWIDRQYLAALGDPDLPEIIEKASVTPAEKQFALGNYQLRRRPSIARKHFAEALMLNPDLACACVEHTLLVGMLGDQAAFWKSLEQLKRFPEKEDVLLTHQLTNNVSDEVVRRSREAARDSGLLKGELAGYLMRLDDPALLVEAYELALASQRALPFDPRRSHTCGLICCLMRENIPIDNLQHAEITNLAVQHLSQAIVSDPYFWPSYEALAALYKKIGRHGEAIRLAQASLRVHPRSSRAASFLSLYSRQLSDGETIKDPSGIPVAPGDVLLMDKFSEGLKQVAHLDLPLLSDEHEEDLRLNGYGPPPIERLVDDHGQNALHALVTSRNFAALIRLAQYYELDWSQRNKAGRSPLHEAIISNDLEAVHWLLTAGADPDVATASGETGWMMVCQQGNPAMLARLTRCSAIPATAIEIFRKHLNLPENTSIESIKVATRERLESELDELATIQIPKLLTQYQEARTQWQLAQQQQQQQASQPLPRNNSPIVVPGYIADIGKYDPARAQRMLHRRIGQEVQEELEFQRQQQSHFQSLVNETKQLEHELSQQVQALAYQVHTLAYLALSNEEFEQFASTRGNEIVAQLKSFGIPLELSESPAGRQ